MLPPSTVIPYTMEALCAVTEELPIGTNPGLSHFLLNGINSFATSEKPLNGSFDVIQKKLEDQLNIDKFVYFSYSAARYHQEGSFYCRGWGAGGGFVTGGCQTYIGINPKPSDNLAVLGAWPEYEKSDTRLSLHLQAEALDWLMRQIVSRDPNARIHLVGYSLGGIVAPHWAAHQGRSANWKRHVTSIVIIESPVGGIPLADPLSEDCGFDTACRFWKFISSLFYGKIVFPQLQMPEGNDDSIVGSLPNAARAYPLTSIQSTTDYMVNNEGLPFCYIKCADDDIELVPVGRGTQFWVAAPHTLHFDRELGGDGLATEPLRLWDKEWKDENQLHFQVKLLLKRVIGIAVLFTLAKWCKSGAISTARWPEPIKYGGVALFLLTAGLLVWGIVTIWKVLRQLRLRGLLIVLGIGYVLLISALVLTSDSPLPLHQEAWLITRRLIAAVPCCCLAWIRRIPHT